MCQGKLILFVHAFPESAGDGKTTSWSPIFSKRSVPTFLPPSLFFYPGLWNTFRIKNSIRNFILNRRYYLDSFSGLSIHRGKLPSTFRSCAPCDTGRSVPFSIDHMPVHPISLRAAIRDTMLCLSMLLPGRFRCTACNDRRSFSLLAFHTPVPCR